MSAKTEGQKQGGIRGRDVLLGTTTLAVAAASIPSAYAQGAGTQPSAQPVTAASGKPEGIQMMIGRLPYAAFGNSVGDRQMLEYASGPALGLPNTKVRAFTQALYDEAQQQGWVITSMKNDWKRIFAFDH